MKHKWMARALSLVMVAAFLPGVVLADTWYLEDGDIKIEATLDSEQNTVQQVTQGTKSSQDDDPIISSRGEVTNTVTIEADQGATANVTLDDVNIDVSNDGKAAISTTGGGNVTIELEGENTLKSGDGYAGLEKNNGGNLTIQDQNGDGALKAEGGYWGAGIGGGSTSVSDITITGGTIEATGGNVAAGIGGGGRYGAASKITISGGYVTATGTGFGAGIGGGKEGDGTEIKIENATVIAAGGTVGSESGGAGIGGGGGGSGRDISISNATVSATGGYASAGIGGSTSLYDNRGYGENITISGGNVIAIGGDYGAGIGGAVERTGKKITIDDANVEAIGGKNAAAIGSGADADDPSTDITVKNNVNVMVKDGASTASWSRKTENINASDLGDNGLVSITQNPEGNPSNLIYKSDDGVKEDTGATYVSSTDATCTAPGTITYTLQDGTTRTLTRGGAPALGHTLEHHEAQAPTCTASGWDAYDRCTRDGCGYSTYQEKPALPHSFTSYVSQNDATCTQDGHKSAKCDHCDAMDVAADPGSKLNHSFTNYVSDNNATCLKDGTKTAACDHGCGEKKTVTDVGSQLSHSFTKYTPDASGETETALCDNDCGTKDTRPLRAVAAQKTEEQPAEGQQTPLYQVTDEKGNPVSATQERTGKVLTITVKLDNAALKGTVQSLRVLQAQGIETVVFQTNQATSTFDVASVPDGTGYTLTHTGKTVTFTLDEIDIGNILK